MIPPKIVMTHLCHGPRASHTSFLHGGGILVDVFSMSPIGVGAANVERETKERRRSIVRSAKTFMLACLGVAMR